MRISINSVVLRDGAASRADKQRGLKLRTGAQVFRGSLLALLAALAWSAPGSSIFCAAQQSPATDLEVQQAATITTRAAQPVSGASGPEKEYEIGPEDVLNISVFDVPELSNLDLRVANDGTISLPLLGLVKVSGMTPLQVRRELEAKWGQSYLQNPQVSIFVKEYHAQPVSVLGAVEKPAVYQVTGPRTLIDMLSLAGGMAKRSTGAAGRWVYVSRPGGFKDLQPMEGLRLVAPDKAEINLRQLFYSNESALNLSIQAHDIILVSKADIVYVTGRGVEKPGGFMLEDREKVTVFQALAMAGGLSANASRRNGRIIRQLSDGSRQEIPVDLDKVLKGDITDPLLSANDILFVPSSAERAAMKRGAEAIVGTISGLLIYGRF